MATRSFAPWAEVVPERTALMTADELLHLPDDDWCYELVEGRLVRIPLAGSAQGDIMLIFASALRTFVQVHEFGRVVVGDTGFTLSPPGQPETVLGSDVALVRTERLPPAGSRERQGYLRLAPDLVVEVVSPDQHRPEMHAKARLWLAAGVRLLWLIWPRARQVEVWLPGSDTPVAVLGVGDALDGRDVLPGFAYPVARLFE